MNHQLAGVIFLALVITLFGVWAMINDLIDVYFKAKEEFLEKLVHKQKDADNAEK